MTKELKRVMKKKENTLHITKHNVNNKNQYAKYAKVCNQE